MRTAANQKAACDGYDPEMWFPMPTDPVTRTYAIEICQTCPLLFGCRDFALENYIRHGIWGGIDMEVKKSGTFS